MTATFKCLASGQTVTFIHQVDIDSMKGHSGYEEVKQEQGQETTKEVLSTPVATKKTSKKSTTDEE